MPEKRKVVDVVLVEMQCPKCSEDNMKPTGIELCTYPPQYPHVCPMCNYMETFKKQYPLVTYESVR